MTAPPRYVGPGLRRTNDQAERGGTTYTQNTANIGRSKHIPPATEEAPSCH